MYEAIETLEGIRDNINGRMGNDLAAMEDCESQIARIKCRLEDGRKRVSEINAAIAVLREARDSTPTTSPSLAA